MIKKDVWYDGDGDGEGHQRTHAQARTHSSYTMYNIQSMHVSKN